MKVLYLCPDFGIPVLGRKGASVHVRALASAFQRAGHSVVLATPLLSKSLWERPEPLDLPILEVLPDEGSVSAVRALKLFSDTVGGESALAGELRRILYNHELARLARKLESDPPDLIYERASLYGIAGVALAHEIKRPLFIELNAPLALEQSAYRATELGALAAQAERWTLTRADAVLCVSASLAHYAISLGAEPSRVHISPNGVDPALFQPAPAQAEVRTRWGLNGASVLGFVGGLRAWHGVKALPPLLERLIPQHLDLQMVIAGAGPLRRELERDFEERGLAQHVLFTGSLPHQEIAALIRQFDVALAPYDRLDHAFYFSPLKLFEYMGCGVPVVAAKIGQIADVVRDGETGLLYRSGDLDELAAACARLLADPLLRQRLGEAAAREVRDRYTWDRNVERVIDLARFMIAAREEQG